jgi:hypothetical protein
VKASGENLGGPVPDSIFTGVGEIMAEALGVLGIGQPPHLVSTTSYRKFDASALDGVDLVARLYSQTTLNWDTGGRSALRNGKTENWRWERQTTYTERNRSKEKVLEKRIVNIPVDGWVNMIPTASGIMGSGERQCNVDLAHECAPDSYEFVELKWGSDTPLYAAYEILRLGVLYLFSRTHRQQLEYSDSNRLLAAKLLRLAVLAPSDYYEDWGRADELCRLEEKVSVGLQALCRERQVPVTVDFQFQVFPSTFDGTSDAGIVRGLSERRPLCAGSEQLVCCVG